MRAENVKEQGEAMSGLKIPKDKILYVEVLLYQISLSSLSDTFLNVFVLASLAPQTDKSS